MMGRMYFLEYVHTSEAHKFRRLVPSADHCVGLAPKIGIDFANFLAGMYNGNCIETVPFIIQSHKCGLPPIVGPWCLF